MTADAGDRAPEPILAEDTENTDDTGPDELATPEGAQAEGAQAEGAQSELDLGVLSTGSVTVDSALAPLDGLAERPVSGHAEVFEQVLDELAQTMAEPTDEHGSTGPGVPPASH